MAKNYIFILLIISNLFFQSLSEDPIYDTKNIEDMKSSFFNSLGDGFYYLGSEIIPQGYIIIAFSDLDGDGFTDIITYKENDTFFDFYQHIYNKDDLKFEPAVHLFYVDKHKETNINSIRNLYVGGISEQSKTCYLASFNTKNSYELLHYSKCGDDYTEAQKIDGITSNILIMNRNVDYKSQILYKDGDLLKICILGDDFKCNSNSKNFSNDPYRTYNISLTGGLAYVDIDGNCAPDVLLSYEIGNIRYIEIFLYDRKKEEYIATQNLTIGDSNKFGPFAISRLKLAKSDDEIEIPQFDILFPNLLENKILAFENGIKETRKWSISYCVENDNKDLIKNITFEKKDFNLYEENNQKVTTEETLDNSSITVLRTGDFSFSSIPGILVRQNKGENSYISLFTKETNKYSLFLKIGKNEKIKAQPKSALFFDINESGSLGLIVQDMDNNNHFFFNFRKNTFFIKAKLMNNKYVELNSDINLGAYYRYIVTDQSGIRRMDISYQMVQTSDMNIPLPYSLCGIGETNNYIENFQVISGNYYKDDSKFVDPEKEKNFMLYTPIIPNTQMKIYKFRNSNNNKYEWYIDLIVQPTDSLIIIIIILIAVMLAILGVVIYLYIREVKEEQKEESKFKSWFA